MLKSIKNINKKFINKEKNIPMRRCDDMNDSGKLEMESNGQITKAL